jgi:hypothetical protein
MSSSCPAKIIEFDARSREKENMNHIGLGDTFEVL